MPSNGRQELRYYDTYDTSTAYTVITDQIGVLAADTTPFSIVASENKSFVNFLLHVRSASGAGIRGMQRDEFNSYNSIETKIRPKTIP